MNENADSTLSVKEKPNQYSVRRKSKKNPSHQRAFSNLEKRNRLVLTQSGMWDAENDLFQAFEVEHDSCWDLEVEVTKGEEITKGSYVQDLCDTPDPYVVLKVLGSSNSSKRTSHIDNTVNPIWNETFHFYLDPNKQHVLQITLMDANMITKDDALGMNSLDVNSLPLDTPMKHVVQFVGGSKVFLSVKLQKNKNHDLRFSLALCEEEKKFLRLRRIDVMNKMQKMLGDRGPKDVGEVPVVAVLGSGGGFRAMVGLSGCFKVLHQSGILGCATYISGLSGSSWLISSFYAHDKFPNLTYDEVNEELRKSVTQNWKWNLVHFHRYCLDMIKKYQGGQPVSFTDIFGHILGDLLLRGEKFKKLSDQRDILQKGTVPLPLYPCLHVKASVSCKAFSEWIEFSPFEIGIAKYGTFMRTEDFGSKFIVGKLVKKFPEFPLHYLQGVWGSAYTILIKRLVMQEGPNEDAVQMMRKEYDERELNEKLEADYLSQDVEESKSEKDSGSDDELDFVLADDEYFEDARSSFITRDHSTTDHQKKDISKEDLQLKVEKELADIKVSVGIPNQPAKTKESLKSKFDSKFRRQKVTEPEMETKIPDFRSLGRPNKNAKKDDSKKNSSLHHSTSNPSYGSSLSYEMTPKPSSYWQEKRNERRTLRLKKSSFLKELLKNMNLLNSRVGRAGEILNPFRGLSLKQSFPFSPFFTPEDQEENCDETEDMEFDPRCRYEALDNKAKKLFVVDSGLAFNSPYPLLLRPQRAVDMYISFDFSQRPSDRHMPFKELILAEKWANQNNVPFPPIAKQAAEFEKIYFVKELYIFKDENDPFCPVILHFPIVNNKFKWQKAPGVPRVTKEEFDFADFSLFNDKSQPFASTNFVYEPLHYERLVKLMEFNALLGIDAIKEEFAKMVVLKRKLALDTTEHTFNKIQKVMSAVKKFKKEGSLRLKFDEKRGRQLLNPSMSSSFDDDSANYSDARMKLDSFDEENEEKNEPNSNESDYHTDDGIEEWETKL